MELQEVRKAIERFAHCKLRAYIDALQPGPRAITSEKEFSDPVWKTIYLTGFEVVLLDSPLLQRLRLIKQLGVAHWVFPGAVHTRFEHALGTLYQVQELTDSINRASGQHHELLISDGDRRLLRMTALCHDLGHGLMSHVSENALRSRPEVEKIKLAFIDEH